MAAPAAAPVAVAMSRPRPLPNCRPTAPPINPPIAAFPRHAISCCCCGVDGAQACSSQKAPSATKSDSILIRHPTP